MRYVSAFTLVLLAVLIVTTANFSQDKPMESSRGVAGGGISVPGWTGKIDAKEEAAGMTLNSAKLEKEGNSLHVTTGPAVTYWNPKNTAKGDYTVTATFTEPKYMNLNSHPHPYGNGKFIVRGFGPEPFQLNGPRGAENAAVNKAAGQGQPVTQEIALSVKG